MDNQNFTQFSDYLKTEASGSSQPRIPFSSNLLKHGELKQLRRPQLFAEEISQIQQQICTDDKVVPRTSELRRPHTMVEKEFLELNKFEIMHQNKEGLVVDKLQKLSAENQSPTEQNKIDIKPNVPLLRKPKLELSKMKQDIQQNTEAHFPKCVVENLIEDISEEIHLQQDDAQEQLSKLEPPEVKQVHLTTVVENLRSRDMYLDIPKGKHLRNGGTRGQPCIVESNYFTLNINPKFETAIHYDVTFIPDKPKRLLCKVWETFRILHLKNRPLAFDGIKNVFSPTYFDDYCGDVLVGDDESSKELTFKVKIKFAAEVNLRALSEYVSSGCTTKIPQDALQCIDVVLRNAASVKFVKVGRCFFSEPKGKIIQLGDGMELWHGNFQSAVIGWKPFLNVDVVNKGFPSARPVIDIMEELARTGLEYINENEEDYYKVASFLKGLKVLYEIPNYSAFRRIFRVNYLGESSAAAKFVIDEKEISVVQYFAQYKNYRIKFPNLPVLWVGPKDRKCYLPPELCTIIPGQVTQKTLNETQVSNMIRNATTSVEKRKEKILHSVKQINLNADPVVKAFGLSIGQDFEKINARLLSPPSLEYKNEHLVKPHRGVWKVTEFLHAESLENKLWTIISLDRNVKSDMVDNFARMIVSSSRQVGMQIGTPCRPYPTMTRFDPNKFETFLNNNRHMKLIFVIIPEYPTRVYNQVKQKAELVVGSLTQCIKSKTMLRMSQSVVSNILLKVNSKLSGHNHTIAANYRPPCLRRPCIIMGADITHPNQIETNIPSVAAVTASCDSRAFQYNFIWRLQPARQEIIQDLENIVKEQLISFRRTCNQIPQRIIFFRDGVSEGQFQQVMNEEIQAIRRACSSLGTPGFYKPGITFIVVQKRHHTRFFPTNRLESDDKNGNVRAGTVVDTNITHPTAIEYYLVSHASIQGVARPTKYRVLWDDCSTSEDELEALTYYLCHMFSRCTRSVSYPAPTYYAHLAALRAKVYLDGQSINLNNLDHEQKLRTVRNEIIKENPMFFV